MTRTYNQMHRTDKYSEHSSTIWQVRPNDWSFVNELSGSGFEWSCIYVNFRFRTYFMQELPWHSRNYRVSIHLKTRTWHDNNIRSNAPYRWILRTQLNHLASFSIWPVLPVWQNVCVFVYELSGSGFQFSASYLNFRFRPSFEQGAPWHWRNCKMWIHSETPMWHQKIIQSNAAYR